MPKRSYAGLQTDERPAKIARPDSVDRLSLLSDELLLRILSFVPISTLSLCQRQVGLPPVLRLRKLIYIGFLVSSALLRAIRNYGRLHTTTASFAPEHLGYLE